jgi:hypothetical protein
MRAYSVDLRQKVVGAVQQLINELKYGVNVIDKDEPPPSRSAPVIVSA